MPRLRRSTPSHTRPDRTTASLASPSHGMPEVQSLTRHRVHYGLLVFHHHLRRNTNRVVVYRPGHQRVEDKEGEKPDDEAGVGTFGHLATSHGK